VRARSLRKLVWFAAALLALLPAQLAIERGVAYWLLPREESATLTAIGDKIEIDHVDYVVRSIPLTTFTWHLLHVTKGCFVAGLALLVFAGIRSPLAPTSRTARALLWILLPVAVLVTTVASGLLIFGISQMITDRCAQQYGLDVSLCPAPWAGILFSSIAFVGSAAVAGFGVLTAYAAAPTGRVAAMGATAALLSAIALWLGWRFSSWQVLSAIASALAITLLMSHRRAQLPRTI
jgi:hypothetical protein